LASALALLGLTAVAGVTLHQVFEFQAREDLQTRARLLAEGAAAFLSTMKHSSPSDPAEIEQRITAMRSWLESDPDFESIRLGGEGGRVLFREDEAPRARAEEKSTLVATSLHPRGSIDVLVRVSTRRLSQDLENIRWLFASIFLFACAVFAALAIYFTRGVVLPLEEIRRAAHRIMSGETNVRVPVSGDHEIDEIAHFFISLAERRGAGAPPEKGESSLAEGTRTAR
jgi:methyl-accepting chemotaxis protein